MKTINVDVAIIGAGTAGMTAYRELKKYDKKVVLIEGGAYGTTCARVGCMPSKLLIAAAESAHQISAIAPQMGVRAESIQIDGKAVMERVKRERDRFVNFVVEDIQGFENDDLLRGYARFVDAQTLRVDEHSEVRAKSIIIATGSSPFVPDMFRDLGDRLVLNDDVFAWDDLPESIAVFGAGVVGLELGQALSHLGVRVQLFSKGGRIANLSDPEITSVAKQHFSSEFPFYPDAEIQSLTRQDNQVEVRFKTDQERCERFDYALVATGRRPNLDKLNLKVLGLELNKLGLPPFDSESLQIADLPIFLAGDVSHERPLLHEAVDEGKIAAFNAAFYPYARPGERRSPLSIVFTHPQIATVGSPYSELPPVCTAIGEVSFENQGRSRVILQNKGKLRIYADYQKGQFLGAEMFGPQAEHLAHLLAWAHQQKLSIDQMLDMPFYHPVIEEGLRTALRKTAKKIRQGPPSKSDCFAAELVEITG